jgi:hypothetical protein
MICKLLHRIFMARQSSCACWGGEVISCINNGASTCIDPLHGITIGI